MNSQIFNHQINPNKTMKTTFYYSCVIDRTLLAEIIYDEKSFTAYAHTHVFRYADRFVYFKLEKPIKYNSSVQLFFTCTVQLCFREDGGCEGISPPHCLKNNNVQK